MEAQQLTPGQAVSPQAPTGSLDDTGANAPVSNYSAAAKQYPIESLEVHKEGSGPATQVEEGQSQRSVPISRRRAVVVSLVITLLVLLITAAAAAFIVNRAAPEETSSQLGIPEQDISVSEAGASLPELEGEDNALLVNGDIIARGDLKVVDGDYTSSIQAEGITANHVLTLPDASGTVCLDSNNCNFVTQDQIGTEAGQLAQQAAALASLQAQLNQLVIPPAGVTSLNNQAGAVTIQGTLNRISVSTANGVITLTTPQDLDPNANVQFGNLTLGPGGQILANNLQQTAAGNDISVNAGNDDIIFTVGGRTFQLPTSGPVSQTICTTDVGCGGGGGGVTDLNTLTGSITLQGTTDQITVTTGAGTITLSTPQNINTTSSPTFAGLTLTTALGVASGGTGISTVPTNGQLLIGNGAGYSLGTIGNGGGLTITNGAGTISIGVNYGSTANTAVQGDTTLICASGIGNLTGGGNSVTLGAGGTCNDISIVNNPTFSTSVTTSSLILTGVGSNGTLQVANLGQATAYTLPDPGQATANICLSTGNCAGAGSGVTTGGGTTNRLAKFTSAQNIEDSSISDDGSTVTINGNVNLSVQGTNVTVGAGASRTGSIVLHNSTNTNTVTLQSGVTGTSYALTLPTAVGGTNQCLKAQNGTGTLFWDDCLGGGGGGGITSINGQTGPSITINNATGAGNAITIDDALADDATKGIAAFNSTNFTALGGVINTIQDIATTSSPQFSNLTLTGDLAVNGGEITSTGALAITPGGALTVGATTQTTLLQGSTTTVTATGQIILNAGSTIELQDNTNITGNLIATGTGAFQGASVTVGGAAQAGSLILNDGSSNIGTLQTTALGQDTVYNLIDPGQASVDICLATGNCIGGGGGAPNNAEYLVVSLNGTLTNERALASGSNIVFTDGGANGNFTIATVQNPTFTTSVTTPLLQSAGALQIDSAGTLDITAGNAITVGSTGETLTLQGSATTITSNGVGNAIIINSADTIELQDNTNVTGNLAATGNLQVDGNGDIQGGIVTLGTSSQAGSLILNDGNGQTATISVGSALAGNTAIAIPTAVGASDTFCLLTLGNCFGAGTGNTLQAAYNAGNTITTTDNRNIAFTLADTVTDANFITNIASGSTGRFAVQGNGTDVFGVTSSAVTVNQALTVNANTNLNGNLTITSEASGSRVISARFNDDFSGTGATTYFQNSNVGESTYLNLVSNGTDTTGIMLHNNTLGSGPFGVIEHNDTTGSLNIVAANILSNAGPTINLITKPGGGGSETTRLSIDPNGNVIFNPTGTDSDFRIQGDNNANLFFVDAGNDRIGIGDATPAYLFTVGNGDLFGVNSSGNVIVTALGLADSDTVICRNSSSQLAACSSTFATTSNAFLQGGNDFGGTAAGNLGTINNGNLNFITNNVTRLTIDTSGNATLTGNLTVQGTGTSSFAGDLVVSSRAAIGSSAGLSDFSPLRVSETFDGTYNCETVGACYGTEILAVADNPAGVNIGTVGLRAGVGTAATAFTLDRAAAITAASPIIGAGSTIDTNYGLFVENMTGANNNYGIYVEGADTYAIWVNSGLSRLDGNLEVRGDGTNPGEVNVGIAGAQRGLLVLQDGSSGFHSIIRPDGLTGNHAVLLPDDSGTICLQASAACGFATGSGTAFVQGGNDFGGTGTLGLTSNNDLNVTTNNLTRLTVQADGDVAFDTDTLFVDAANNRVGIGNTAPAAALEVSGDIYLSREGARTIKLADSTTASTAGAALSILGANGNEQAGGGITVRGGDAVSASGAFLGGVVTIRGGNSTGFTSGGRVDIIGGDSLLGGNVRIDGGSGLGRGDVLIQSIDPNGEVGIGITNPDARLELGGNMTKNAWGLNGIQLQASSATYTDGNTAASGTATNAVINSFGTPTLAATNTGVTTTNAATVYIQGAPTAGTNQTITNAYALWVDDGATRLDGTLTVSGATTINNSLTSTGQLLSAFGSAGAPTYSFDGNANTGIFRPGSNQVGISTNGTLRLTVTTAAVTSTLPIRGQNGTAAAPALSFTSDTNTGIYRVAEDQLGFSTGGANRVTFGVDPTAAPFGTGTLRIQALDIDATEQFDIWGEGQNDFDIGSGRGFSISMNESTTGGVFNVWSGGTEIFAIRGSDGVITTDVTTETQTVTFLQGWLRLGVDSQSFAGAGTLTPLSSYVEVTCTNGAGCALTMDDTTSSQGQTVFIVNVGTNTVTFADTAGVQELSGGCTAGQWDSITMIYASDRWVEYSRSDNSGNGAGGCAVP